MKELKRLLGIALFFAVVPVVFPSTHVVVAQPEPPKQEVVEEPKAADVENVPVSTVTMYSHPGCPPCRKFLKDCQASLEKSGWKVVVVYDHDYKTTPTFEIVLATDPDTTHKLVGYRGRSCFYKYLNSLGVKK